MLRRTHEVARILHASYFEGGHCRHEANPQEVPRRARAGGRDHRDCRVFLVIPAARVDIDHERVPPDDPVVDLSTPIRVPAGAYRNAMLTKEWTPLEPDVLDHKYYVRGIGEVREVSVRGATEALSLVTRSGGATLR